MKPEHFENLSNLVGSAEAIRIRDEQTTFAPTCAGVPIYLADWRKDSETGMIVNRDGKTVAMMAAWTPTEQRYVYMNAIATLPRALALAVAVKKFCEDRGMVADPLWHEAKAILEAVEII